MLMRITAKPSWSKVILIVALFAGGGGGNSHIQRNPKRDQGPVVCVACIFSPIRDTHSYITHSILSYNPSNLFARVRLVLTRHVTEYPPAKTGGYPRISPNFQNCARCEKDLKDNKHDILHLGRKYARIFVLGHYLFLEAHSFLELRSRKTVRFSEQIMSADKYPSIFSRQMEAIVYIFFFNSIS